MVSSSEPMLHMASRFISDLSRRLAALIFTPQPLMAVGVLFSPMVSGWAGGRAGGRAAGNSLSRLYLRNRKV